MQYNYLEHVFKRFHGFHGSGHGFFHLRRLRSS